MRLRTKVALYLVVFIFLILASLQLTKALIIQPSFQNWEKQECNKGIAQSLTTLGYQLGSLGGQLRDYSSWDDTYDFVQYGNQEYVESNFVDSTFIDLNLNIIAIVNNNKSIRYCQSFDLGNSAKVQTSEETRRAIVSDNSLWTFSLNETTISGIMLMDSKAMFVATAPILSSLSQGPAMGGMLFGKYIDAQEVNKFTKIMGLNFSLHTLSDFRLQKENDQIVESFLQNEQTVVVREESPDIVSGYALVRDIDSNPSFVLQVSQDRIVFKQGVWVGNIFLASELLLATIFGIAVLLTLERKLIKPLTELANYVEQASLNPNASTPKTNPTSLKEMAVLTDAVRNTLKRKLEGMNEVSRMVAHDLRNPLSGIKTSVYLLSKYNEPEMADKRNTLLKTIVDCVEYSDKIVKDLLEYSSEIRLDKIKTNTEKLVCDSLSTVPVPSNVQVIKECSDGFSVFVDIGKIERVFSNLIKNAFDAMPEGGQLKIDSRRVDDQVEITFSDSGVGMSEDTLKKLWTPFFTTKAKGFGVGLSICQRIIDAHEGRIEVKSTLGKGTVFTVFLCISSPPKQS